MARVATYAATAIRSFRQCRRPRAPRAPHFFALTLLLATACIGRDIAGAANAWNGAAFSAEMFDPAHPGKPVSRIYLGDGRVRLESEDTSSIGAIVLDPAHGTTLIVNDPAKSYIDAGMFTSLVTVGFAPLMKVLRPAGSGDPCSQWNSAVNPFGAFAKSSDGNQPQQWTCKSLGSESVNGRSAQKWAVTSNDPSDGPMTIWVDDKLHVLSRTQEKDGTMEMRNIHEGPQPDSLFTPPANYKKISISGLLGGMMGGGDSSKGGSGASSFLQKLQSASTALISRVSVLQRTSRDASFSHHARTQPQLRFARRRACRARVFGTDGRATALTSERDQNFCIESASGARIVLKIANAHEDRSMLEAQQQALMHVAQHVDVTPRVLRAKNGETLVEVSGPDGRSHSRVGHLLARWTPARARATQIARAARGFRPQHRRARARAGDLRCAGDPSRFLLGSREWPRDRRALPRSHRERGARPHD